MEDLIKECNVLKELMKIPRILKELSDRQDQLCKFRIIFNIEPTEQIKEMGSINLKLINEQGLKGISIKEILAQ